MHKKLNAVIYHFQHQFLPAIFFDEKYDLIGTLIQEKDILYKIFQDICDEQKIKNPYTEQDFTINYYQMDDVWYAIDIQFPEPEACPQCYHCYLFFEKKREFHSFFTLEKSFEETDKFAVLCAWERESHLNYGAVPFSGDEAFVKAFELHKNRYEEL